MQVVTFASIPHAKPAEFIAKLIDIHQFFQAEPEADLRAFKRWTKENELFDKEHFEALLEFLNISQGKSKALNEGKFLPAIHEAADHVSRQKLVFKHLAKKNELLVKYIMDGLAERLYSTNELYRYITSYVYPGEYITLVNFKAWMDWLQASEHIKMIGIRWGLSSLGEEAMSYIRIIDVDEILEGISDDDEEEPEDEDDDEATSEPASHTAAAPLPEAVMPLQEAADAPAPKAAPAPSSTPSHSSPPAHSTAAAPSAAPAHSTAAAPSAAPLTPAAATVFTQGPPTLVTPSGVETVRVVVQPIRPVAEEEPLRLLREAFTEADEEEESDAFGEPEPALQLRLEQLRLEPEQVADNVRAVLSWWQRRPGGKLLRASDYGFSAERFESEPAYAMFRLSALAVSLFRFQGRLNVGKGGEAFGILDQMGFFENLFKSSQSVEEILEALFNGGLAQRPELFSNLHYFLLLRRSLRLQGDDGVRTWAQLEEPAQCVSTLWQHLAHFSLHYEIFWILRELHVLGAWPSDSLAELSVVPLPKVRETAFRLGLLETPYAADFPTLLSVSRRLSRFFGKEADFEAPLVYFEPRRALHYDASEPSYFSRDQLGLD
ncbi:MAG: hypothetical protein RBU37_05965 [Myxococcota bacterium]|jgi:hypothetical protein|nr:hypothetical protein [Myxococcota bacterium]